MGNPDSNIFEDFYSSLMSSLLTEEKEAKKMKETIRTRRKRAPAITSAGRIINNAMLNDSPSALKDFSIVNFLFSEQFFKYLDKKIKDDNSLTQPVAYWPKRITDMLYGEKPRPVLVPNNISIITAARKLQDYLQPIRFEQEVRSLFNQNKLGYRERYNMPTDPSAGSLSTSHIEKFKRDESKRAVRYMLLLSLWAGNESLAKFIIDNDKTSEDPIKQITWQKLDSDGNRVDESYPPTTPTDDSFVDPDDGKSNLTLLDNIVAYCENAEKRLSALVDFKDRLSAVYNSTINKSERKLLEIMLNNNIFPEFLVDRDLLGGKSKVKSLAEITNDEPHLDPIKIYDYMTETCGITPQEMKKCLSFIKIINDRFLGRKMADADENGEIEYEAGKKKTYDTFSPTDLTITADTSQLSDITSHTKLVNELLKTKNTLNLIFSLNDIFSDANKAIKENPHDSNSYLALKENQIAFLAAVENEEIKTPLQLYIKIAKIYQFLQDIDIGANAEFDLREISKPDADRPMRVAKKIINDTQTKVSQKMEDPPYYLLEILNFCQIMAFPQMKNDRGVTVFPVYTKYGDNLKLTLPTTDLIKTIDEERVRLSFSSLDGTNEAITKTMKSYVVPFIPDSKEMKAAKQDAVDLIETLENNIPTKNKITDKKTTFRLRVDDKTIDNFKKKLTEYGIKYNESKDGQKTKDGKTEHGKLQLGEVINKFRDTNVIINFVYVTDRPYSTTKELLKASDIRIQSFPNELGPSSFVEITTPLLTIDVTRILSAASDYIVQTIRRNGSELLGHKLRTKSGATENKDSVDAGYAALFRKPPKKEKDTDKETYGTEEFIKTTVEWCLRMAREKISKTINEYTDEELENWKKELDSGTGFTDAEMALHGRQTGRNIMVAMMLFGKGDSKIKSFVENRVGSIIVGRDDFIYGVDTKRFLDDPATKNDRSVKEMAQKDLETYRMLIMDNIASIFPIILYDFILFNYQNYQTLTNEEAVAKPNEDVSDDDIDSIFNAVFYETKNIFDNRENKTTIKAMDDGEEKIDALGNMVASVLASKDEFGRIVNTVLRGVSARSTKYQIGKAAFNEIAPIRNHLMNNTDFCQMLENAIKEILDITYTIYPRNKPAADLSVNMATFGFNLVYRDAEMITRKFVTLSKIFAEDDNIDYSSIFKGHEPMTKAFEALYKNVVDKKYTNDGIKILALKDVVLYYYFTACLVYLMMRMNSGLDFGERRMTTPSSKSKRDINDSISSEERSGFESDDPNRKSFQGYQRIRTGDESSIADEVAPAPAPAPAPATTPVAPSAPAATPPAPAPKPAPAPAPAPAAPKPKTPIPAYKVGDDTADDMIATALGTKKEK